MRLSELFKLVPEQQEVILIYDGFKLTSTADAMNCMLDNEVFKEKVVNIEAESGMLKVWIEDGDLNDDNGQ